MRVAIFTIFNGNNNYGGVLQAYALQHSISKIGHTCYQIMTAGVANMIYPSKLKQSRQYSLIEIIKKIYEKRIEKRTYIIKDKLLVRLSLFEAFRKNNIKVFSDIVYPDKTEKLYNYFDAFVVGSDQVWNPNVINKFFFLNFHTNKHKKISYSASIGRSYLNKYEKKCFCKYLNSFDNISVREESAKSLLEQSGINVPIKVTLDPTLLLSPEEWNKVASDRLIKDKYVLLYGFSYCKFQNEIKDYYERKGLKVYYIPYVKQVYNKFDGKSPLIPLWDVGPTEFISLIKYAEAIITDSFHGAVFSIIYNKQFFVFKRDKDNAKTSKNVRLNDLLNNFGLEDRLISNMTSVAHKKEIDYQQVNKLIEIQRKQSLDWLSTSLQ